MNRFKRWLGNPYLTYTSLRDSGMIQMAIDYYEEKGEVTREDYKYIYERFNYGAMLPDGYWHIVKSLCEYYRKLLNE